MTHGDQNMLGLLELADAEDYIDAHGVGAFNMLRDACFDRLKTWVRSRDQLRQVGDNRFCVILRDIKSRGELELATAKLARIFEEPYHYLGRPVLVQVKAGFAATKSSDTDDKQAMQQAGQALRQVRKSNRVFDVYSTNRGLSPSDERAMVRKLEVAVERGELHLYYQPKVHAGYRSLVGAEALVRWHTEDGEIIMPDRFIGIAERYPVINAMTVWALKSAIARLARWSQDLSISVNVPPTLLLSDDLLYVVKDSLEIHEVKASRLTLEVTESIMADNQDSVLQQLSGLRELGVKISLDDFGTGFSSLAYFRDLPVDEIKIDKGFVMHMIESEKDHAIVKAVIDLAHNFSLRVVAEGVETLEIAKRLADMNCDILQGYVFDRALPVDKFERDYGASGLQAGPGGRQRQ